VEAVFRKRTIGKDGARHGGFTAQKSFSQTPAGPPGRAGSRRTRDRAPVAGGIVTKKNKPAFDLEALLSKIGSRNGATTFAKSRMVFAQGDTADAVYFIQKGSAKVTVVSKQGKEAIVAVLGANDFFGEGCLAGQKKRIASVKTLTDSVIIKFEKTAVTNLIQNEPEFSEAFIAYLLQRTIRVEADLVDQLFNSSEKRLARLLLLLVNFGHGNESEPKITKISQESLAEMIGTTRSRVSFFMNKFRKLGFINYNGHIEVFPALLNVVLHDHPHIAADTPRQISGKSVL
jgi:CRP-like cAMP-binding protein